jgi:hypothetical protein
VNLHLYPIAIIEDRYGGTYSGGAWLAIANAYKSDSIVERVTDCLESGPHGDDVEAAWFWANCPDWIAAGNTPDEALAALYVKNGGAK